MGPFVRINGSSWTESGDEVGLSNERNRCTADARVDEVEDGRGRIAADDHTPSAVGTAAPGFHVKWGVAP